MQVRPNAPDRRARLVRGARAVYCDRQGNALADERMTTGLPFDDYRRLIAGLPGPDEAAATAVRTRLEAAGAAASLGRLGELGAWLAAWSARKPVAIARPMMAVFAGNHGVAGRAVSRLPVTATAAMVEHCAAGGAAINQICLANDVGLKVFDLALDMPTADITVDAALDERGCAATMAFGMEAVAGGTDLLCIGDLGVGGDTVAATVLAALLGGTGADWIFTGPDEWLAARRVEAVDAALALHGGHRGDPLEVMRRVGGRETAAIAGAILAARVEKTPVILDGWAALASAVVLYAMEPTAIDHCQFASSSGDPYFRRALSLLERRPLLDLDMESEAGTGGALAVGLARAAALCASGIRSMTA